MKPPPLLTDPPPRLSDGDRILFFDLESTGLPPRFVTGPPNPSDWPHVVSASWALYTTAGLEVQRAYHVIIPSGFVIPEEAAKIHGITTERAMALGVPLSGFLRKLTMQIREHRPALVVAHNVGFDKPLLAVECLRCGIPCPIEAIPTFCTMTATTDLCRIPRRDGNFKWPSLSELHSFLFGVDLDDAHHAGSDMHACAKCFFELQQIPAAGSWRCLIN